MPRLAWTKPLERLIHPTRALASLARAPAAGDPKRLREACLDVLRESGAGLVPYAAKHVPDAVPVMSEVAGAMDALEVGSPYTARAAAAMYRVFRYNVPEATFVGAWVKAGGLAFAIEAIAAVDAFELVLAWIVKKGSGFLATVVPEHRRSGVPLAALDPYVTPPSA